MGMKGEKVRAMSDLFHALNEIILTLVNVIMWSVLESQRTYCYHVEYWQWRALHCGYNSYGTTVFDLISKPTIISKSEKMDRKLACIK